MNESMNEWIGEWKYNDRLDSAEIVGVQTDD